MRDMPSEAGDNLDALALLYANGEMELAQSADFERRLSDDQRAREALCQAVELARILDGLPTPLPSPAYRAGVRQRLAPQGAWRRLTARRHRGHPLLWATLGVAAAILVFVLAHGFTSTAPPRGEQTHATPTTPAEVQAIQPNLRETALIWSEIPKHERMNRLWEEEQRRRTRADDVRLVRNEAGTNRLLPEPMPSP
jgi:anti-sigma-K factor RskA